MADMEDAVKIAGEWTKQLALWATGTLVLSLGFLKDFLKDQKITGGWWWCLVGAWFMLICSVVLGHLAFGAPLTGAGKHPTWKLEINSQTRWLSGSQLVAFVLGLAGIAAFVAFHVSADRTPEVSLQLWKPIGCVGPFVVGSSSQLEQQADGSNTIRCADIPSLAGPIRDSCRQNSTCLIVLVGSADKRPLRGRVATNFGSNEGLARARSEWVREQLVRILSFESNRFLVLTVGPREHGTEVAENRLQFDRAVQIHILARETKSSKE